jgi:hypothetical protein
LNPPEHTVQNLDHVVRACVQDPALKAKLIANPAAVLAEHGVPIPAGTTIKVLENTASVFHLVIPSTRPSNELSDNDLASAAGGGMRDGDVPT